MGWYRLNLSGSGYGPVKGSSEHGNETSGSVKCREILEQLRNWRFLTKDLIPWSLLVTDPDILMFYCHSQVRLTWTPHFFERYPYKFNLYMNLCLVFSPCSSKSTSLLSSRVYWQWIQTSLQDRFLNRRLAKSQILEITYLEIQIHVSLPSHFELYMLAMLTRICTTSWIPGYVK
jgi:hypothetical protein